VLGRRFSGLVAIQPRHSLVSAGISGVIRHPSYLGALVFMLGDALVFRSGVGILLTAVTLVPRIASEETLLQCQFGTEYDAYRAHPAAGAIRTIRSGVGRQDPLGAKTCTPVRPAGEVFGDCRARPVTVPNACWPSASLNGSSPGS
jgi:hypothetical protein